MCWFSAHETNYTRNAIEGEELVVHQLSNPHRRWLVSPKDTETAVCLRQGCQVRLNEIPENLQEVLHVGPEAIAEFHESYHAPRSLIRRFLPPEPIHDALVFASGSYYRVGQLPLGMKIDVLSKTVATCGWENNPEWAQEPMYTLLS